MQMNQSIENIIKFNDYIKLLNFSVASIKLSQSFSQSIESTYSSLKELKNETEKIHVKSSLISDMENMKSKSDQIKLSFKEIGKGNGIKPSIEKPEYNQFKKFREEIKKAKEEMISFNNHKKQVNIEKQRIAKKKQNVQVAIARNDINTMVNNMKLSPINIGIKLMKEDIENKLVILKSKIFSNKNIKNMRQTIKIGFELTKDDLKAKINNLKVSNVVIGIKMAKENIGDKITLMKNKVNSFSNKTYHIALALKDIATEKLQVINNKIKGLMQKPKNIVIKALAHTSLAMQGLKTVKEKCKEKCKEKFSVVVNMVDKTKKVFNDIKNKIKEISKPIKVMTKTFISPVFKEQQKQNDENLRKGIKPKDDDISNAVNQMERVKKSMDAMKGSIGKVFLPIIGGVLKPLADWLQTYQPKIEKFLASITKKVAGVMQTLQPTFKRLFDNLSKTIDQLIPHFKKMFDNIPIIIKTMQPVFEKVFDGIGVILGKLPPIFNIVIKILSLLGKVWKSLWPTISSVLETAWAIIEPIFSIIVDMANIIVDIFTLAWPKISGAIEGVWNYIEPILGLIAGGLRKIAEIASSVADFFGIKVSKRKGNGASGGNSKNSNGASYAIGLSRVPYDNYPVLLHEGERVLTKQEVNSSRGFGSVNIGKLAETVVVREEADIDKIAAAMVNKLERVSLNMV